MWGSYMAYARAGTGDGLVAADFVFLRFATSGALILAYAVAVRRGVGLHVGVGRSLALAACAGPLFVAMSTGGYAHAPLSHGVVIQPSTAALSTLFLATLLLGERFRTTQFVGVGIIVLGLALLVGGSPSVPVDGPLWLGDLMFVGAGLSWAAFTILLRRWRLSGIEAAAAISLVSGALVFPAYLLFTDGAERLSDMSFAALAAQVTVHGVLSGTLAFVAFGRAVERLGAGRAGLFPAVVPVAAMILGIPVAGEIPGPREWLGAVLATLGLCVAVVRVTDRSRRIEKA